MQRTYTRLDPHGRLSMIVLVVATIVVAPLVVGTLIANPAQTMPSGYVPTLIERRNMADTNSLLSAFPGNADIYLAGSDVAAGKPSLSHVECGGVIEAMDGERFIYFRSNLNHHWLVNPKYIIAAKIADPPAAPPAGQR